MGISRWDKKAYLDSEISHSLPRLRNVRHFFELHRDLKIAAPYDPHVLAMALSDEALVRVVAPDFLRNWHGSSDRWLLDEIALAIEQGKFAGKSAVRFGVTPIPDRSAKKQPDHYFEIRFIVVLEDVIAAPLDAAKVAEYLGQASGLLNSKFKRGLGALLKGLKHPTNPKRRGAYPEFDRLLKKIFSPTRKK